MQHIWDWYCSLKVFASIQWAWKVPSLVEVLHLMTVEMEGPGSACPCSQTCDPETHPMLCCKEQRRRVCPWAIRNPGLARRSHSPVACLPQWKTGQNHVCSWVARHSWPVASWAQRAARKAYRLLVSTHECLCIWVVWAHSKPAWLGPVCVISFLVRRCHLLPCLWSHNEGPCTFIKTHWIFDPL